VDVTLDDRTLHEVYLPHFRRCVDAGVSSVMSAYNKVHGEWAGHSTLLLEQILRRDWGFQGFVTSDWVWGIHGTAEPAIAGMDIEMPRTKHYGRRLLAATRSGAVSTEVIERNARRVVRTKLRTVTRDDPRTYPRDRIACAEHRALAQEAAEQSMVLLRNEADVLPLDSAAIRKLAVIGTLAQRPNTGDRGSSRVSPPDVVTFLQGIRAHLGDGVEVVFDHGRDLDRACAAAEGADAVVIVAGCRHDDEGENLNSNHQPGGSRRVDRGGDRGSLRLRPLEEALIREIAPQHPRCAVVLVAGSAIVTEPWERQAPAILMAWYAGMAGGTALARVLFGEVNPSGRLPFTIPRDEAQLPPFDPCAEHAAYGPYHGYTLLERQDLQPGHAFGSGLSYTTFEYGELALDEESVSTDGEIVARVTISNTGDRAGAEVAQCYVGFPESPVERPRKLLRGFDKVRIDPGHSRRVTFRVPATDLARYEPGTHSWIVDPGRTTVHVGPSSDDRGLQTADVVVTDP
jgi:beta-glucosidase